MLFNTFPFALFFVAVATLFFALPHRFRWAFLLAASYVFYGWSSVPYLGVIAGITLLDYFTAIRIEQSWGIGRRIWLGVSLAGNLGLLGIFKYAGLGWALPVGISFHTFQAISYTVDVYRGKIPAERHPGHYALFVAFFPQMVAGPIERGDRLLPQFHLPQRLDWTRIGSGLQLTLRGLIKKAVIADLAAPAVNQIYGNPRAFPAPMLLLATILFSVQIYCDFSGYSDMAAGLARVLGYDLTINFREPWRAATIEDFWHRWHISLSTWFRDYVYIPLGGSRVPAWRWALNIMAVFLLSGLWHGANRTFVVWGALHGAWFLLSRWTRVRSVILTNAFVAFAWIFFRANNLSDAFYVAGHLFNWRSFAVGQLWTLGLPRFEMVFLLLAIPALLLAERSCRRARLWMTAAGFYAVVFFGVFEHVDFIYFRF